MSKRRLTAAAGGSTIPIECGPSPSFFLPSDPPQPFEYDYCAVQRDQMESRAPPFGPYGSRVYSKVEKKNGGGERKSSSGAEETSVPGRAPTDVRMELRKLVVLPKSLNIHRVEKPPQYKLLTD